MTVDGVPTSEVTVVLHPNESRVLAVTLDGLPRTIDELSAVVGLPAAQVTSAVEGLRTRGFVNVEAAPAGVVYELTQRGRQAVDAGIPEAQVLAAIAAEAGTAKEIADRLGLAVTRVNRAVATLVNLGSVAVRSGVLEARRHPEPQLDLLATALKRLVRKDRLPEDAFPSDELRVVERLGVRGSRRALVKRRPVLRRAVRVTATGRRQYASREAVAGDARLRPEDLRSGAWRERTFRPYDLTISSAPARAGRLHGYRQFLDWARDKLLGLGFDELTGEPVDARFWSIDVLFTPQWHPAQDAGHLFYVSDGQGGVATTAEELPPLDRLAAIHETGGDTGSRGWKYSFDRAAPTQLVLRSQGTALSARAMATGSIGRWFTVARCFRYDTVDAGHTPDFFMVEGIVVEGDDASIPALLGWLEMLTAELLGLHRLTYVPTYHPFTEPSVQIRATHPKLGPLTVGGGGRVRPEITAYLDTHPALLWWFGLNEVAMASLGLSDVRALFSTDLDFLRAQPVAPWA